MFYFINIVWYHVEIDFPWLEETTSKILKGSALFFRVVLFWVTVRRSQRGFFTPLFCVSFYQSSPQTTVLGTHYTLCLDSSSSFATSHRLNRDEMHHELWKWNGLWYNRTLCFSCHKKCDRVYVNISDTGLSGNSENKCSVMSLIPICYENKLFYVTSYGMTMLDKFNAELFSCYSFFVGQLQFLVNYCT